jgi:hypothetical protein
MHQSLIYRYFSNYFVSYTRILKEEGISRRLSEILVDAGEIPGKLGSNVSAQIFLILRKENLWPIYNKCLDYSEDDLFDIVEFIYDYISKPIDGWYHQYDDCWHYNKFQKEIGQQEFRERINEVLRDYKDEYELSEKGEILVAIEPGLDNLMDNEFSEIDPENIENRINSAKLKFRRYRSSQEERRDAVRNLADILEFLKPKLKLVLTQKDESDLFNIANNFGIRHHNDQQRTNYDKSIWYEWMFYYYLATIRATLKLIKRDK